MFNSRKDVEAAINNAEQKKRKSPRSINPSHYDTQFTALPQADELVKLWSQITQLRNDIAHVGMNLDPQTALNLKQKAESLYPHLQKVGQELLPDRVNIE